MNDFILIAFLSIGIQLSNGGCTLDMIPLKALYGFNDEIHLNITMDDCKKICLQKKLPENKDCHSVDYIMSSDTCLLSSETQTSKPEYFGEHKDAIYFERKCDNEIEDEESPLLPPGDCKVNQRGSMYRGQIQHTVSGRLCQAWSSQTPHGHGFKESWKFVDRSVTRAMNYCRNPNNPVAGGPWCYTTDPNVRWEFCNIPECTSNCATPCYSNPCRKSTVCLAHHPIFCNSDFCGGCKQAHYNADGKKKLDCSSDKPPPPFTTTCLLSSGVEYQGTVNVTRGGYTCQRWDSQLPHKHSVDDPDLLDLSTQSAENYCRNIGGSSDTIWCYTTDPQKRWEYCNTPKCAESVCSNPDMWALGQRTDRIKCYRFLFDEQDHMPWHEARTYCRRAFPPKADNAAVLSQVQLDLLRVNAEGFVRESQLSEKALPSQVVVWFAGGNLLNLNLLPPLPKLEETDQYYALRLWPGKPQIVSVNRTAILGVICNEV